MLDPRACGSVAEYAIADSLAIIAHDKEMAEGMPMRFSGACAGLILAVLGAVWYSASVHAGPAWRHFSQVTAQSVPVFVDLDGDGTNEVAYVGGGAVSVHEWGDDGILRLVDVLPVDPAYGSNLLVAPGQGSATQTLIVTIWGPLWRSRILEIGGKPLRIMREFEGYGSANVVAVGDIDSDGEIELLVQSVNMNPHWIRLIDYATQTEEWSVEHQDPYNGAYSVGPLDATGIPWVLEWRGGLSIRDGATGLAHWDFPWAAATTLEVARLAPGNTRGFIATRPGYQSSNTTDVRVFQGLPPVPGPSYSLPGNAVTVFDVNQDGVDEAISVPHPMYPWAAIYVHDLQSGSIIDTLPSTQTLPASPGFGVLTSDGPLLMAYVGRLDVYTSTLQPASLSVLDLSSRELLLAPERRAFRFRQSLFADVDGDGELETIVLGLWPSRTVPGQGQLEVQVFSADGNLLYQRDDLIDEGLEGSSTAITTGDLDGVPGDELIIVGRNGTQANVIIALGGSLDTLWRKAGGEDGWPQDFVDHIILANSATSGMDVMMVVRNGATVRLVQLRGSTGELLGQTALDFHPVIKGLTIAQMDTDPAPEIVVYRVNHAQWVDAWSRQLEGSLPNTSGDMWANVIGWNEDSRCRLGLQRYAVMNVHDCQTKAWLYDVVVPGGATVHRRDMTRDRAFLATHDGHLLRLQDSQPAQEISGYLGRDIAVVPEHMATPAGGVNGDLEVTLTSASFAMRYRVEGRNLIFRDSFGDEDVDIDGGGSRATTVH